MADNVHRKSHRLSDGSRKVANPVHRTTTETIRLGEVDRQQQPAATAAASVAPPCGVAAQTASRKKTSSFQITSVTVGCRMSNDAGEDSNDDLDESHTEENSRVTDLDLETPSYSEDTFSKEDVFFNTSSAALSTAPVIPTSSQYGLAIVPSSEGGGASIAAGDSNNGALDGCLASAADKQDAELREVHSHGRNERFKVVKIESTEPFKRGRWTCMDYLDHTSVNQPSAIGAPKVSDPNEVCISYGVTDSGIVVPEAAKQPAPDDIAHGGGGVDANGPVDRIDNPAQAVAGKGYAVGNSLPPNVQHNPSQVQPQAKQPSAQQQQQQIPQYFQSQTQSIATQQQQQQQQQQPPSQPAQGGQGSTLPSSLQQAAAHPSSLGQPQSMPQGSIPIIAQAGSGTVTPQPSIPHSKEETYVTVQPVQSVCQPTAVQQASAPTSQAPNILVTQHQQPEAAACQQPPPPKPQMTQISEPLTAIQGMPGMPSIHKVPQTAGAAGPPQPQPQASSTIHPAAAQPQVIAQPATQQMPPAQTSNGSAPTVQIAQVAANCQSVVGGLQQGGIAFHQSDPEQESIPGIVPNATAVQSADATLLESLAEVTQGSDENRALEDNESMSGTSAVAIDNKIEQAMDLVKSHLMFAVREEVEVLKEKIAELMDRINQLEAENSILKAHATPETLAQLSQSTAKLPQNNSGSGQ